MTSGLSPQRPDDILAYDIRISEGYYVAQPAIYSDFYLEIIDTPWAYGSYNSLGWWTLDLSSPIFLKNYDVDVYIGITDFFGTMTNLYYESWGPEVNLMCYEVEKREYNDGDGRGPGGYVPGEAQSYIIATAACYREKTQARYPDGTPYSQWQYNQGNVNTKFYKLQMNRPEPLTKLHFLVALNDNGFVINNRNKTLAIGIEFSLGCKNKTSQRPGHKRGSERLINSCS